MTSDLRNALQMMVDNFKPFRARPMGAPNSAARLEQEAQIAAHNHAVAVLAASAGWTEMWRKPFEETNPDHKTEGRTVSVTEGK